VTAISHERLRVKLASVIDLIDEYCKAPLADEVEIIARLVLESLAAQEMCRGKKAISHFGDFLKFQLFVAKGKSRGGTPRDTYSGTDRHERKS
jgi:hypothetical protein